MNKCFSIIILLLFFLSVNCITASNNINLDDCSTLEKINLNIKECVNFFNNYAKQINKTSINDINIKSDNTTNINKSSIINSTNIHFNTSNSFNLTVDKSNKSLGNNLSIDNVDKTYNNSNCKYNKSNDLIKKDVNISKNIKSDNITVVNKINNHELSKFNNTTDINKSSVINVYPDTSNLGNNSSVKYNKNNLLFNDTLHNQSQFNKSFKVFELDKDSSVYDNSIGLSNDSIGKELNSSEINNISNNNNSSRDNHVNHVSEPKQDKDYIMLLIPILLGLLGAIILYKKNK